MLPSPGSHLHHRVTCRLFSLGQSFLRMKSVVLVSNTEMLGEAKLVQ